MYSKNRSGNSPQNLQEYLIKQCSALYPRFHLRFSVLQQNQKCFCNVFFIKNLALSNIKTAVYIYTGRCAGGYTQFFMTLNPVLGTGPVRNICQIHPNTNHLLISSELFWQLKVCWAPEHTSPLSTFLQQVLSGLEQLLQLQGTFSHQKI